MNKAETKAPTLMITHEVEKKVCSKEKGGLLECGFHADLGETRFIEKGETYYELACRGTTTDCCEPCYMDMMKSDSSPPTPLEVAKKELASIKYDLACVIVPDLLSRLGVKKMGESLGKLNDLQERLSRIDPALESQAAKGDEGGGSKSDLAAPDPANASQAAESVKEELRATTDKIQDEMARLYNSERRPTKDDLSRWIDALNIGKPESAMLLSANQREALSKGGADRKETE